MEKRQAEENERLRKLNEVIHLLNAGIIYRLLVQYMTLAYIVVASKSSSPSSLHKLEGLSSLVCSVNLELKIIPQIHSSILIVFVCTSWDLVIRASVHWVYYQDKKLTACKEPPKLGSTDCTFIHFSWDIPSNKQPIPGLRSHVQGTNVLQNLIYQKKQSEYLFLDTFGVPWLQKTTGRWPDGVHIDSI